MIAYLPESEEILECPNFKTLVKNVRYTCRTYTQYAIFYRNEYDRTHNINRICTMNCYGVITREG